MIEANKDPCHAIKYVDYIYIYITSSKCVKLSIVDYRAHIYSKTSLNRATMGPTLSGWLREVIGLGR